MTRMRQIIWPCRLHLLCRLQQLQHPRWRRQFPAIQHLVHHRTMGRPLTTSGSLTTSTAPGSNHLIKTTKTPRRTASPQCQNSRPRMRCRRSQRREPEHPPRVTKAWTTSCHRSQRWVAGSLYGLCRALAAIREYAPMHLDIALLCYVVGVLG